MMFTFLAILWPWVSTVLAIPTIVWLVSYLIPQIFMCLRPVPNLKTKYVAEWALVTGSGTGIGRSLAFLLARQGLNVVLVSLDDEHLKKTKADLQQTFPTQQFRSVGVNFAPGVKYMEAIRKETANIAVKIVFCNAGFMVTGFIDQTPIEKLQANMECNATSAVNIAHHFVQIMIRERYKGCIVFTSSVAAFVPAPFAVMYASTKAFVSQFAACLHIETKSLGIDVCAIHPSPVASHFYDKLDHKIDLLEAAAKNAVSPDDITNDIVKSVGACALRDLGSMAWGTRMGTFFIPYNAFVEIFALAAPLTPDWKTHNKNR
jgi:short-subunit dehydrogenase